MSTLCIFFTFTLFSLLCKSIFSVKARDDTRQQPQLNIFLVRRNVNLLNRIKLWQIQNTSIVLVKYFRN